MRKAPLFPINKTAAERRMSDHSGPRIQRASGCPVICIDENHFVAIVITTDTNLGMVKAGRPQISAQKLIDELNQIGLTLAPRRRRPRLLVPMNGLRQTAFAIPRIPKLS